jgi:hypothetical protein
VKLLRASFVLLAALAVACSKKHAPAPGAGQSAPPADASAVAMPTPRARFDTAEVPVPAGKSMLHVAWSVPQGTAINDEAPFAVRWGSSDGLVTTPTDIRGHGKDVVGGFEVPIDVMPDAAGGMLGGDLDVVVCDTITHSVCVPIKRRLELTFAVVKGSPQGRVTLPLPKAKP